MRLTGVSLIDHMLGGVSPGLPLVLSGSIGSGCSTICLQLAATAVARGERVLYVTLDSPAALAREAQSLGCDLVAAVREERLVLLELDANVGARLRAGGAEPLVAALRAEAPDASLVIVTALLELVGQILDPQPLRRAVETLLAGWKAPDQVVVASGDFEQAHPQASLATAVSSVCGALVELSRRADGRRFGSVIRSRLPGAVSEPVEFALGAGGAVLLAPGEPAAGASPAPAPQATERRSRVLVIDEDEAARAEVVGWLSERYEVFTASDGFDALSSILSDRPDVIVLELVLPRVSGYEVLRACQRSRVATPILVLSARLQRAADRIRPLVLGASDLLTKPPTRVELLHRIETLLTLGRTLERSGARDGEGEDLMFLTCEESRSVNEPEFRARVERTHAFGQRYGVTSSLVALEAQSPSALDGLIAAAEETLRIGDAVLQTDDHRALALLVAANPDLSQRVVGRISVRARRKSRRRVPFTWSSRPLRSDSLEGPLDKLFDGLAPFQEGGA